MIRIRGLCRRFGPTVALDDVSLDVASGRIVGLLGENGAGKTTLMNVLYGLVPPDAGQMWLAGVPYSPRGPRDALASGVGMVHQHFMLVPRLTVAQNMVLGMGNPPVANEERDSLALPRTGAGLPRPGWGLARPARLNAEIAAFADRMDLPVDAAARVEDLSVGQQQRVEILKALSRDVRVLILDEPTAVLTPDEAEQLFAAMRRLRERGVAVVFISHKLREIVGHCDDVAVLRRGRLVHAGPAVDVTTERLAEWMVGAEAAAPNASVPRRDRKGAGSPTAPSHALRSPPASEQAPVLELHNVAAGGATGVHGVDLCLPAGQIVGIAGVDGNGQDVLAGVATGLTPAHGGRIMLDGLDRTGATPAAMIAAGVAHIPNDRQREGLILDFSVSENAVLKRLGHPSVSRGGWLRRGRIDALARGIVEQYDVRTASLRTAVRTLSGGNQQKLLIGREMQRRPRLVVAMNPTRGLDVAASAFVRRRLVAAADGGAAVLLISSDLDELLELSDRIHVLFRGRLTETGWPDCDLAAISRLMAGLPAVGPALRGPQNQMRHDTTRRDFPAG